MFRGICDNPQYGISWVRTNFNPPLKNACDGRAGDKTELGTLNAAIGGMFAKCMYTGSLETKSIPEAAKLIQDIFA